VVELVVTVVVEDLVAAAHQADGDKFFKKSGIK
jgi:hypothetical protein